MFWVSLQILSENFLIIGRIQQDIINVLRYLLKVLFIIVRFLLSLEISRKIVEKNAQISNLMKIIPVPAELFHADGETKLITDFRNFAKAPKKDHHVSEVQPTRRNFS